MTKKEKTFTTFDISKICDVYPTTVANWIDEGKIKAFVTPGGHRRVNVNELREFLESHGMTVPDELKAPGKAKILVVDDDKIVLDAVVKILKYVKKYSVFTAEDGFKAGQAVVEHDPALIILDLMLPGIDGFEVCRTIRKKNKKVKIIAITGYNTEENKKKIIASGADAYLGKPFEMEVFLKMVEDVLSK